MTIDERIASSVKQSCDTCRVLETCPCPIMARAVSQGLEVVEKCEMYMVVEKVYQNGRSKAHNNKTTDSQAKDNRCPVCNSDERDKLYRFTPKGTRKREWCDHNWHYSGMRTKDRERVKITVHKRNKHG